MPDPATGISRLFSDSLIVLFWQGVRLVSSYAFVLALAKMIDPEGIARYANFIGLTSIAVPIFLLKPEAIVARAKFFADDAGYMAYAGSVLGYCIVGSILCGTVLLMLLKPIETLTGIDGPWLLLLVPYLLTYGSLYVTSTIIQLDGDMPRSAATRGVEGLLRLMLGLLLVGPLGFGWYGALAAVVVGMAGAAALSWYFLARSQRSLPRPGLTRAVEYAREGAPTVPLTLAAAGLQTIDRFWITSAIGLAAAGVYAFGAMLATGIWLLAFAFQQAWTPWIYGMLADPTASRLREGALALGVFLAGTAVLGAALAVSVILGGPYVLSDEYAGLGSVMAPLCLAAVFSSWRLMFEAVFYYFRQTWWLSAFSVAGLSLSAGAIWLSIHEAGVVGVAWAMAGANAAIFLAAAGFAMRSVARHARGVRRGT